jgi:hypothetical protein
LGSFLPVFVRVRRETRRPTPMNTCRLAERRDPGDDEGGLAIIRIEGGTNRPSVDVALAIARELDQSVESLFGGGR